MASATPRPATGVFISHRKADAALAQRLAEQLRDEGFDVWFDEWRIDLGDSIVAKIDEGLEEAKYLVLCYSDAGIHSPWMSREWMSALARQLSGADVKLLPIRLSGGTPPAILADIKYADLAADWDRGFADLLRALKK